MAKSYVTNGETMLALESLQAVLDLLTHHALPGQDELDLSVNDVLRSRHGILLNPATQARVTRANLIPVYLPALQLVEAIDDVMVRGRITCHIRTRRIDPAMYRARLSDVELARGIVPLREQIRDLLAMHRTDPT